MAIVSVAEIDEFESRRTTAPVILVLGETGAGKSHFINRLAGRTVVRESARLQSCTQRPEVVEFQVGEHAFLMIDTPGFNDTWRSDGQVLAEICRTLTLQMQLGMKLRGILILHDLRRARITGSQRRQIQLVQRICGPKTFSNILLLTTHWPSSYEEETSQGFGVREAELPSSETFWAELIKGGARMLRWYDDEEGDGARSIIAGMVAKRDIVVQLQEELRDGKKLDETSAASFIVEARRRDEIVLDKLKGSVTASGNSTDDGEVTNEEIAKLQESVKSRKAAETRLQDDPISRVRKEIHHLVGEARRKKKDFSTIEIFRWLVGISGLTVQVVQTALTS